MELYNKETIIRLETVKQRTGLSRSSIYLNIHEKMFPRPIAIGKRSVGWIESEVDAWISQQIQKSRPQ